MNPHYEQFYQEMMSRLASGRRTDPDPLTALTAAVEIAQYYRTHLPLPRVTVTQITYFKQCLPPFEAEVQYQQLCLSAQQRRPTGSLVDWKRFYLLEAGRLHGQIEQFPQLYSYFTRGANEEDEIWFGGDPALAEEHALQIASFIALGRYEYYLETLFTQHFNP